MAFGLIERGQLKWHFGSDQSVWRDGDWNGFAIVVCGAKGKCRGRKVRKSALNRQVTRQARGWRHGHDRGSEGDGEGEARRVLFHDAGSAGAWLTLRQSFESMCVGKSRWHERGY